jgi:hypothetical protein
MMMSITSVGFLKKNTDITPQLYRETVGFGKAESN